MWLYKQHEQVNAMQSRFGGPDRPHEEQGQDGHNAGRNRIWLSGKGMTALAHQ
jgi:hypothetical protein